MDVPCPECGEPLELLEGDEMASAPRRYVCESCCVWFECDASGLLTAVDRLMIVVRCEWFRCGRHPLGGER